MMIVSLSGKMRIVVEMMLTLWKGIGDWRQDDVEQGSSVDDVEQGSSVMTLSRAAPSISASSRRMLRLT